MEASIAGIGVGQSRSTPLARFATIAGIGLACAMLLVGLGDLPLQIPDESRNAEVAREMSESGAWLVPTLNGLAYLDKPCFYFKLVALSFSAFGVSESAARLTSVLAALALLGAVYLFCRREFGALSAGLSLVVISTSPLFFVFGRMVIFDMLLSLFVTLSILTGYLAEAHEGARRRWWWAASAFAAALATLVKGPVGFILPGLVLIAYFLSARRPSALKRLASPINFVIFFATVLPWFIGVTVQRPDFPKYGLVEETFQRYTTDSFNRGAPWYFYGPMILVGFLPWSALLFGGVIAVVRHRRFTSPAERLFLVWAVVVVAFFSTSHSKLPGYVLPGIIALGVLVARIFARAIEGGSGPASRVARSGLAILGIVCLLVAAASSLDLSRFPALGRSSYWPYVVRNVEVVQAVRIIAIGLGLASIVIAIRFRPVLGMLPFVLMPVLVLPTFFGAITSELHRKSSKALADKVVEASEGSTVACLASFPSGLPYHLRRTVVLFTRNGHELRSRYIKRTLSRTTDWPETVVPLSKSGDWLDAREHPTYLVSDEEHLTELEAVGAERNRTPALLVPGWYGVLLPRGPG